MRQRTSASSPERRSRAVIVEDVGEPLPEGIPDRGNKTELKRVDGGEWWRGAVSETKLITVSWHWHRTSDFLQLCSQKHCMQAAYSRSR